MNRYKENETTLVAAALQNGALLAFPTDTVYGLGTLYGSLDRLERLKHAKHRPETKPVPFMTDSLEKLSRLAQVTESAARLAQAFLPGALTLVLKRSPEVDPAYTNGMETIAVRIPDAPALLAVMKQLDAPLLVTSANQSGQPAALTAAEAAHALPDIDGVMDGSCAGGVASTIVDCTCSPVRILRQGPVSEETIRQVLEEIV
ncbi:L-threonylcarbamoyladenylate synthase [Faecalibaculum rodentium]|uniref:L-threonylcarbamoyladenylate synthase n=1 Tax=Faecalibaculum rodentium TaxID=1702221 RepID=UPI002577E9FD|nr:L-threonylcarbamoyladenylate synthase [Faecalibaculum rodentium]